NVGFHGIGHFPCDFRRTCGGIVELEQWLRESEEIVDGARPGHGRDCSCANVPVRGDHEYGAGLGKHGTQLLPRPRESVDLQRVHGTAMSNEQSWHLLHGATST